jgi:hypothetical protein
MENLKTLTITIPREGIDRKYEVKERDHGDLIVYDIFLKNDYLLTTSREGDILFMNFEASPEDQETFKLTFLRQVVDKIKSI